jgi:ribosomal-protein-alanine N-acetyltransferase
VDVVSTERLELTSVGMEFMHSGLLGRTGDAGRIAGVRLPDHWFADNRSLLEMRRAQLRRDPAAQPWLLRLIVLRATREFVGYVNFHEPPEDRGWVEIGYEVEPHHRRRGYASEAAEAMFEWAAERGVDRFRASVSPANEASLGMVAKLGFRRVGVQWDEVDGEEIVFEATHEDIRSARRAAR